MTEVLGLEKPLPATDSGQNDHYRLERPVTSAAIGETSKKFIDFYRRGSFILETKQGSQPKVPDDGQPTLAAVPAVRRLGHGVRGTRAWDKSMVKARGQADNYARSIAREDGWPLFVIVCDVGYVFEIYADFSGQGHGYNQFPDGTRYRIFLDDLTDPGVQQLFRDIWNNPHTLDPSRQSAKVTREIADQLALLGRSFEKHGHPPEKVAGFLMRCLFSMFAEDVDLIPRDSFTDLLKDMASTPEHAAPALQSLWQTMDKGGFSPVLRTDLLKFNGGLFAEADALPLDSPQIALLIGAAHKDWKTVEPAIFGTLLERALDKRQRHKLGAHYTPRAYVERLIMPTVIEPLRSDWQDVQTSAYTLADQGKMKEARDLVTAFHRRLCETRVLDPACGSGNFLYVALELMKRLEGEVTALLDELGEEQSALGLAGYTVDPHQFLGIELNPWAAKVAELVLWIGYLQWHFRTYGKATPAEPVLRDFHNIENRDAVLDYTETRPRMENGVAVTRWDAITTKAHPVTGEDVPDETARVTLLDYANPKPAKWPETDFIVGNPSFIGASRMREALGDGYAEALWAAYPKLTLTQMYNVLEKLRAGERIEGKDREIYDAGLIGMLRDIHDRIDRAVAEAYGWPADLSEDDILHRLVALNHARAAEEAAGHIRWLRPDYQNPAGRIAAAKTGKLDLGDTAEPADKPTWPKSMPDQVAAVRDALSDLGQATPEQVARSFKRGRATSVLPLLESMTALGLAARSGEGVYRPTR